MFKQKISVVLILSSLVLFTSLVIFFGKQLSAASQNENVDSAIGTDEIKVNSQTGTMASKTTLQFCNRTSSSIFTAYVNKSIDRGWNSHGWFKVQGKKCQTIDLGFYIGNVYVYAQPEQQNWERGDTYFCINKKNRFDFPNSNEMNCSGSELQMVGMIQKTVKPGQNIYNFNP
jgi:uncharacterized membrane protein